MRYTIEEIARVVHEANRALQAVHGDPCPSPPWDAEQDFVRQGTMNGVILAAAGDGPRELHEAWYARYREDGWTYGEQKDWAEKTHPCLVPYDELPPEQQDKNEMFNCIVKVLSNRG